MRTHCTRTARTAAATPSSACRSGLHGVGVTLDSAAKKRVHFLGSSGDDGPELVAVDGLGDFAAGVADEPGSPPLPKRSVNCLPA
jgi:hypothetical protein